jgi:hypothetical protein
MNPRNNMNSKKGTQVLNDTVLEMIIGGAALLILAIIFLKMLLPTYDFNKESAKAYFDTLQAQIAFTDKYFSEFALWQQGKENDALFFLVYFGNESTLLDKYVRDGKGAMSGVYFFDAGGKHKNYLCICYATGRTTSYWNINRDDLQETKCSYCMSLKLPVVSFTDTTNTGENYKVGSEFDKLTGQFVIASKNPVLISRGSDGYRFDMITDYGCGFGTTRDDTTKECKCDANKGFVNLYDDGSLDPPCRFISARAKDTSLSQGNPNDKGFCVEYYSKDSCNILVSKVVNNQFIGNAASLYKVLSDECVSIKNAGYATDTLGKTTYYKKGILYYSEGTEEPYTITRNDCSFIQGRVSSIMSTLDLPVPEDDQYRSSTTSFYVFYTDWEDERGQGSPNDKGICLYKIKNEYLQQAMKEGNDIFDSALDITRGECDKITDETMGYNVKFIVTEKDTDTRVYFMIVSPYFAASGGDVGVSPLAVKYACTEWQWHDYTFLKQGEAGETDEALCKSIDTGQIKIATPKAVAAGPGNEEINNLPGNKICCYLDTQK